MPRLAHLGHLLLAKLLVTDPGRQRSRVGYARFMRELRLQMFEARPTPKLRLMLLDHEGGVSEDQHAPQDTASPLQCLVIACAGQFSLFFHHVSLPAV